MKIALGVTGGVAAYKAAELVRRLQQEKLDVQVVMTRSAQEFITPLTFAALTGKKVITEMFGADGAEPANVESAIEHIAVAQRIDLLLVAPATADILAHFAQGIARDFLSTLYLATKAPVVVAPAMNVNMWEHPATQENLQKLRARGVHVVDPDEGYLACGMTGAGRLAATEAIVEKVRAVLGLRRDLEGQTIARHRRPHSRRSRSGPLPHQSLLRQNGLRARGSRRSPRRACRARQRPHRTCPFPKAWIGFPCAQPKRCAAPCASAPLMRTS